MKAQCCLVPRIGTEAFEAWLGDVGSCSHYSMPSVGFSRCFIRFPAGFPCLLAVRLEDSVMVS